MRICFTQAHDIFFVDPTCRMIIDIIDIIDNKLLTLQSQSFPLHISHIEGRRRYSRNAISVAKLLLSAIWRFVCRSTWNSIRISMISETSNGLAVLTFESSRALTLSQYRRQFFSFSLNLQVQNIKAYLFFATLFYNCVQCFIANIDRKSVV